MPSAIDLEKKELRRQVRERLAGLSPEELRVSDSALFARFLALPQVEAAKTIFAFWGIPGKEPDTARLIGELIARGKTVGLPRMLPGHQMEVRRYDPDKPLVRVSFGISEPGEDCPLLARASAVLRRGCAGGQSFRTGFPPRPTTPGWTYCSVRMRACPSERLEKSGRWFPRLFRCV